MAHLVLGAANDAVVGKSLSSAVQMNVNGGPGADLIVGGSADDAICSGDTVLPVSDSPLHASGCMVPPGSQADAELTDVIFGGDGNDHLMGDSTTNALHGGGGNDRIEAGEGDDLLIGDQGSDQLQGEGGGDMLDINWFEGLQAEQETIWTVGSDTLDGGTGVDKVGYQFLTSPVTATASSATVSSGRSSGTDRFTNVEKISLSKGDDTFRAPPRSSFEVQGMAGNDNIEIAGDPSREYNQLAYCGEGDDHVSIDVNRIPDSPTWQMIVSGTEIMEDGSSDCESTTYVPAR